MLDFTRHLTMNMPKVIPLGEFSPNSPECWNGNSRQKISLIGEYIDHRFDDKKLSIKINLYEIDGHDCGSDGLWVVLKYPSDFQKIVLERLVLQLQSGHNLYILFILLDAKVRVFAISILLFLFVN